MALEMLSAVMLMLVMQILAGIIAYSHYFSGAADKPLYCRGVSAPPISIITCHQLFAPDMLHSAGQILSLDQIEAAATITHGVGNNILRLDDNHFERARDGRLLNRAALAIIAASPACVKWVRQDGTLADFQAARLLARRF